MIDRSWIDFLAGCIAPYYVSHPESKPRDDSVLKKIIVEEWDLEPVLVDDSTLSKMIQSIDTIVVNQDLNTIEEIAENVSLGMIYDDDIASDIYSHNEVSYEAGQESFYNKIEREKITDNPNRIV